MRSHRGFTLIELLVVIGLVSALSVVVVLVLNPAELLRQSRDSRRMSDVASISKAISIFQSDAPTATLGVASTTYISVVDPAATSSAGTACISLGFSSGYHCAASSSVQLTDGTGWVPINLNVITSRSPLSSLPIDPVNTLASGYYYSYVVSGNTFKVATALESQKHLAIAAKDGGTSATLLEVGTNTQIAIPQVKSVTWTAIVGSTANGGTLTKTAPNGSGNSGAVSSQTLASGSGHVEFIVTSTIPLYMVGLSNGSANQDYLEIDFAMYASGGTVQVFENGVLRGSYGAYAVGDTLRVSVASGVVQYWRNGAVVYTSGVAPTYPLLVDTSLYTAGSIVMNTVISGGWSP